MYTTPVYDRTLADVVAKNSKAYLNVADWQRIDNNAQETVSFVNLALGGSLTLSAIAAITTASIPDTDDLNDIAGNIELMRAWVDTNFTITDPDFTEVKDDYVSGAKPNYASANQWEKVLDIMYLFATTLTEYNLVTASGDQFVTAGGDTLIAKSI